MHRRCPLLRVSRTSPSGTSVLDLSRAIYYHPLFLRPELWRMPEEICTGKLMANSNLGAAQVTEVFLSHAIARAIEAVCLLMADSLDLETLMQAILFFIGVATAYLLAAFLIAKSSIRRPDFRCATNQCGCLPRPAQVSEGRSGFRYFGKTGG